MNDYIHVTVISLVYLTTVSPMVCYENPRGFPMSLLCAL